MRTPATRLHRRWHSLALVIVPSLVLSPLWIWAVSAEIAAWRLLDSEIHPREHFDPLWKLAYMWQHPLHFPKAAWTAVTVWGRPAMAGAHRNIRLAGHIARALDLRFALDHARAGVFAKAGFDERIAEPCRCHHGPCSVWVCRDGILNLLHHVHAAQCRSRPRRPRTLFRHRFTHRGYLPRRTSQCRLAPPSSWGDGHCCIVAFGSCERSNTDECSLVSAAKLERRCLLNRSSRVSARCRARRRDIESERACDRNDTPMEFCSFNAWVHQNGRASSLGAQRTVRGVRL
jgi:hypothetical protein